MDIKPRIEVINEKKLVGKSMMMSFIEFRVEELWKSFLPIKKEIKNNISNELISMSIYKPTHFINFAPTNEFEKWAAIEVSDFEDISINLETFVLPKGLYAIFNYRGLSTDNSIYQYIFDTWLPNSEYNLDDRPHFEVLDNRYKNNDLDSEEEIFIPIKKR